MTPTDLDERIRRTYRTVVPDLLDREVVAVPCDGLTDVTTAHAPHRRRRVLAVAAALVAVALVGGVVAQRTTDRAGRVGSAASTPVVEPSVRWVPAVVPPGWALQSARSPLHQGRALFVASDGGARAVALTVYDSVFTDQNPFTDAVDLDGRVGDIAGTGPRFRLRLAVDGRGVSIDATGLDEREVLELGRTIALDGVDGSPSAGLLPVGIGAWTRFGGDEVSQDELWWTGDSTMASVIVSRDPTTLLAYVLAMAGPIERRTVGTTSVLVGGAAFGRHPAYWAGLDGLTSVFVVRDGVGIAVIGASAAADGSDLVDAATSVRQVARDASDLITVPFVPDPTGATCDTTPPDVLTLPFDGFEVGLYPSERSVCLRVYEGTPPRFAGGTQLADVSAWIGETSPHEYTAGLTLDDVATVVFEHRDGRRTTVETHEMAGTGKRVWVAPMRPDADIRAAEYLDGTGAVIARVGRPAR